MTKDSDYLNTVNSTINSIHLTEYSHGAGCGCKLSPKMLHEILGNQENRFKDLNLIVGNESNDDAAVYDLGDGRALISTTDFFMPIVDDPFIFGKIAACNAMSDIYAMGGKPLMAIAIFGWPLDRLSTEIGAKVIEGGRAICTEAGISLAGGHSIDSPEPIFGLSVTGIVNVADIKRNTDAEVGDSIYLSKPLGVGILSTAQKMKKVDFDDHQKAINQMCKLNDMGTEVAKISGINAITDVTGFGLAGHLLEICLGSSVSATIEFEKIPLLPNLHGYLKEGCIPGGTQRNFESYSDKVDKLSPIQRSILFDPQTSGGLLITASERAKNSLHGVLEKYGVQLQTIGKIIQNKPNSNIIQVQ